MHGEGGMHGKGGMHGEDGDMCGRGHAWWWEGVCMAGGMSVGGMCGRGACMAGETTTAVDSTHPTGMHSCL